MANDFSDNPYIIDTPGEITTQRIEILHGVWTAPQIVGDELIITNGIDRVAWAGVASNVGDHTIGRVDIAGIHYGLKIPTLDSGVLRLFVKKE